MKGVYWRRIVLASLVVGILHMLFYAWFVPPWQFPDEPRHYEYVRLVGEKGRPVTLRDRDLSMEADIIRSMARFDFWRFGFAIGGYVQHRDQSFGEIWTPYHAHVLFQPPLYYLITGLGTAGFPRSALESHLILLRLASVLFGILSLVLVALIGHTLGGPRWAALLLLFAALLPGHAFINASVNNDVLAETLTLLVLWAGLVVLQRGWALLPAALMVVGTVAALATKRTTLFIAPYTAVVLLYALWERWEQRPTRTTVLRAILGGGVLSAAVIYAFVRLRIIKPPRAPFDPVAYWQTFTQLPWREHINLLFQSFWGRFGWLNVPLPDGVYILLWLVTALAALGWAARAWAWQRGEWGPARKALLAGGLLVALLLLQWGLVLSKQILFAYLGTGSVPQGRYLYPLLPVYGLFYMGGWGWWLRKRPRLFPGLVALFLWGIALVSMWTVFVFYYGT